MIAIFEDGHEVVWIPVAAETNGVRSRALLPFNGIEGVYSFGYKASPTRAKYFKALKEVQRAYINDEFQVFLVQNGKKSERQKKAKWRHGNKTGSPLLGPTLGWVAVPLSELERVTDADLGKALLDAGGGIRGSRLSVH